MLLNKLCPWRIVYVSLYGITALSSEPFVLKCKDPFVHHLRGLNKWRVSLPRGKRWCTGWISYNLKAVCMLFFWTAAEVHSVSAVGYDVWLWAWKRYTYEYIYNCTDLTAVPCPQRVLLADFSEHFLHLEGIVFAVLLSYHFYFRGNRVGKEVGAAATNTF